MSFIAPGRSGPAASPNVKLPTPGGDVRRNWQSISQLASASAAQAGTLEGLRSQIANLKLAARRLDALHPFKIYRLPSILRVTEDPATDWRKFMVRAGRVMDVDATGTDAIDDDPDNEEYPSTPAEILVPASTAAFWFWLEVNASEVIVRYGDDPTASSYDDGVNPDWTSTNAWDLAPEPDAEHIPIGWVDTNTGAAANQAIVRQLLRSDVVQVGGGDVATRMRVKSLHADGDYLICRTWDGTTEGGTDILVAKASQLRHSIGSQVINGVTVSYTGTYAISGGLCTRTASASGYTSQNEMVLPVWQLAGTGQDAEIWAVRPSGGTGVSGAPIWLDLNVDGRVWCELYPLAQVLSSSG